MDNEALGRPGAARSWCMAAAVVLAMGCAWILWSTYGSYRRSQQEIMQSKCYSNLKHLCLAMHLYAADQGGHLPPAGRWVELTKPYMRPEGSTTCPAAPKLPVGYAYADYLGGHDPAKEAYAPEVYMLWDGKPGYPYPEWRHNQGTNVGYLDGHVKWVSPGGTFAKAIEWDKVLVGGPLPPPPSRDSLGRPVPDKGVERKQPDESRRPSP